jgi:hypothetical protein
LYAQDSWHIRPEPDAFPLVCDGSRKEAIVPTTEKPALTSTFADLYGESGLGNLSCRELSTGRTTQYNVCAGWH